MTRPFQPFSFFASSSFSSCCCPRFKEQEKKRKEKIKLRSSPLTHYLRTHPSEFESSIGFINYYGCSSLLDPPSTSCSQFPLTPSRIAVLSPYHRRTTSRQWRNIAAPTIMPVGTRLVPTGSRFAARVKLPEDCICSCSHAIPLFIISLAQPSWTRLPVNFNITFFPKRP